MGTPRELEGERKGEGEERDKKRVIEGVSMIKEHFIHTWKWHDETPYYMQFNMCQFKKECNSWGLSSAPKEHRLETHTLP
jgi:hypothetical protein